MRLKIVGGRLFDPVSNRLGEVGDLFIEGDRLVSRLIAADRVIDAQGRAVLAGGIDLRGSAAASGVDVLRLWNGRPTLRQTGLAYAFLGYTHLHEPFLTPVTASAVHRQLAAIPVVDVSASLVLNLRDLDVWLKDRERWPEIGETVRFLLERTRSLDVRLVEPFVRYRQEFYAHRTINTPETLEILTRLAVDHGLKFTLEAAPEVLGAPGLEPRAFHLAGLGQALVDDAALDAALAHLEAGITADCGLALPGPEADGPSVKVDLGWRRPLNLRPNIPGVQARRAWAMALKYQGPNLAFSALGAAGAPAEYPRMFTWLLDRAAWAEAWDGEVSARQWSPSEWAWATRALPARVLGLADRGHLTPGARADVALYDLPEGATGPSLTEALGRVHTLIKGGEVVIDNYRLIKPGVAKAAYFRRTGARATALVADICQYRSFRTENLWVPDEMGGPWVGL
jgi:formylmethanofuran dehydrogenase subunit A